MSGKYRQLWFGAKIHTPHPKGRSKLQNTSGVYPEINSNQAWGIVPKVQCHQICSEAIAVISDATLPAMIVLKAKARL